LERSRAKKWVWDGRDRENNGMSRTENGLAEVQMSISRTTEIKSASAVSFDDAMKRGIARALKTLENVRGAWIENQEVLLDKEGKISEYRVQMKITFVLEE
jgi:dodecin